MNDQIAQQLVDKLSLIEGHLQQIVLVLGKLDPSVPRSKYGG